MERSLPLDSMYHMPTHVALMLVFDRQTVLKIMVTYRMLLRSNCCPPILLLKGSKKRRCLEGDRNSAHSPVDLTGRNPDAS